MKKVSLFQKMMNLTHKMIRFILGFLGVKYAVGNMTVVVDGFKAIEVKTGFTPKEVWINPLDPVALPVCHADVDWFDRRIVPGGFVLLVKLSSEYRSIEWIAKR